MRLGLALQLLCPDSVNNGQRWSNIAPIRKYPTQQPPINVARAVPRTPPAPADHAPAAAFATQPVLRIADHQPLPAAHDLESECPLL